jgi:hypothetical protein
LSIRIKNLVLNILLSYVNVIRRNIDVKVWGKVMMVGYYCTGKNYNIEKKKRNNQYTEENRGVCTAVVPPSGID